MAQDDETPILGEVISTQKTKIFYDSVTIGKITYRKNEVVHMEPVEGDLPYVGLIIDIFKVKKDKTLMVNVRWFFRWTDLDQQPNVDREQYPEEVFLGLTMDPNPVEAISSPCNFDWVSTGTYQERMAQKVLCHKKKQFFCSHLYNGECLVPLFYYKLDGYFDPKPKEEIVRIQEEIIGERDEITDEDVDDLSKKKRKVKKEPESRKRKSEGGEDRGERAAKRGRGKNSYSEGSVVKPISFENMRDITLPRDIVLKWQDTKDYLLLSGFFVRVPVLKLDLKSYLLARIDTVQKIEPGDDEPEKVEGVEIKYGLSLAIPEVEGPVNAGIQHVSSHELTKDEFEAYKNHTALPDYQEYMEKIDRRKEMEDSFE